MVELLEFLLSGKNCGALVGGKWLTFDGRTWGATNDGRTCKTPIGGKKLMFEGGAWGTTNDGKTCGATIGGKAWELLMVVDVVDITLIC